MNAQKPIFTEQARCQDCYKCVRQCPVKAIQVVHDSAAVMPERCVYCGTCVNVCPSGAKKVRDDLGRAKALIRRRPRVVASLAPSYVAEFPGVTPGRMIHALKALGFQGVSETALGAEEVSAACARLLEEGGPGLYLSTACPTVVELVRKYHPEQLEALTPLRSPLLAHATLLKRALGEDTGVVFIGPCIAKKLEADEHPALLEVVLTFADLRRWLEERGIDPTVEPEAAEDVFIPERASEGALYPVDGGMIRGIRNAGGEARAMAFSGIPVLREAVEGLRGATLERPLFLELLSCEGGCVNGPQAHRGCGTAMKWMRVFDRAPERPAERRLPRLDLSARYAAEPVETPVLSAADLARALRQLGKTQPEDELNCGGCGYDTCRNLCGALLDGRAEPNMCVSYMRKLAMNKANALIRSMPAGVVIVDEHLMVVECNRSFAETLGGDTPFVFDAKPGMEGADLGKLAPELKPSFARALQEDAKALRKDVRLGDRLLRLTTFPVEPGRVAGGVLQDITEPAVQREQVIQKAQEVIRKNVTTVQQIAFLLGENAAETEMLLDSLASSFRMTPSPLGGPPPKE